MQNAIAAASARLPQHLLSGWVGIAQRLYELGIAVRHREMPADDIGELDTLEGVLWVDAEADADDQVWLLQQAWNYLTIGPHAVPEAKSAPLLYLVPAPRESTDELPA